METAVEWLEKQTRTKDWFSLKRDEIFENAKEMEKQQIIEHGVRCYSNCCGEPDRIAEKESEQIYNSTFKK
jgi:hypothetical protein